MTTRRRAVPGLIRVRHAEIIVHQIRNNAGAVVAQDTLSSVTALDTAFIMQARLCASIIEVAAESKLPVAATQKLLDAITAGMRGLVASRQEVVTAVREINFIQARSNLRETGYGCAGGLAPMGSGTNAPAVSEAALDVR